jgi:arsenate reductase (thioredoxin)
MTDPTQLVEATPVFRQRVLFLCTHNSARSQMAQGLLNWLAPDRFEAFSAGTQATRLNPLAIKALAELGIDISDHTSKTLDVYRGLPFDLVVTVCSAAREACPFFPGARRQVHWGFADPSDVQGSEEERLAAFRHTRDLILTRLTDFLRDEAQG